MTGISGTPDENTEQWGKELDEIAEILATTYGVPLSYAREALSKAVYSEELRRELALVKEEKPDGPLVRPRRRMS